MFWFLVILILGLLVYFACSFFTVPEQHAYLIHRLGKFHRIANPGLNRKNPFLDSIVYDQNLRTEQYALQVDTKTKDNVFTDLVLSIQVRVGPEDVAKAYYSMREPIKQLESHVSNVVRSQVPTLTLDELFEKKDHIAEQVKDSIGQEMRENGYEILSVLVVAINPNEKVVQAMNEINASQRMMEAAKNKGEAEKVLIVKKAEAEADSKALQGRGLADQRTAIIEGLKKSVNDFKESVPGASAEDVMTMVFMVQYFDTLKEIGVGSRVIMLPHSPSAVKDIATQIREGIVSGKEVSG